MPKTTLLVPLDGLPLAETALPLAASLARALDAAIRLLRVVPETSPASAEPSAHAYLERLTSRLSASRVAVQTCVLRGEPRACIVRQASASEVGLVVMTTHGRMGVRRAVLGSVAQEVVARATVPTLLVCAGCQPHASIATVLLATDHSCVAPLGSTLDLARACGARIVLLGVVTPDELYVWHRQPGTPAGAEADAVITVRQQLHDLAARMGGGSGAPVDVRVQVGPVVETIDRVAAEEGVDLIVMSTHAKTGVARAVRGSVADAVVRTGHRPVLLWRRPASRPGQPAALDVLHALHRLDPRPSPPTIAERTDGVRSGSACVHWGHLAGAPTAGASGQR